MRKYFISLSLFIVCNASAQSKTVRLKQKANHLTVKSAYGQNKFTTSLQSHPVLNFPSENIGKIITVKTDIDSCELLLVGKDKVRLELLNGADTGWLVIYQRPTAVSFDSTYRLSNNGSISYEIPEASELIAVLIALSDSLKAQNYTYRKTQYHNEVQNYFLRFKNDSLIQSITAQVKKNPMTYALYKMDSYTYDFGSPFLEKKRQYDRLSWGSNRNTLESFEKEIERFAGESNFRLFYKNHLNYYDSLIVQFKKKVDIKDMQNWLERNFSSISNSIRIIFSPLTGYNQSAYRAQSNGFTEALLFINFPFDKLPKVTPGVQRAADGLVAFTELNHNYINPASDKFISEIDSAFNDRSFWADSLTRLGYPGAYEIFNEYVNWSLACLYYSDRLSKADSRVFNKIIERTMTDGRGFRRFVKFNETFLNLYKTVGHGKIENLYSKLLDWSLRFSRNKQNDTNYSISAISHR